MIRRVWPITIALLFLGGDAFAGNCDAPQTSGCIDSDTLWAHAGPRRFVAVGGAETMAAGNVSFGLVTSWQVRPVTLRLNMAGMDVTKAAIDNQINSTFLFAWAVTKRLELEAALPVTIYQNGTGLQPVSGGESLHDTAARDLRFGAAFSIVPHLLARFEMSAPVGDKNAQMAGERTAVFVPSITGDYRFGHFFIGGEIGARVRPDTTLLNTTIGTQLVVAGGGGYDLLEKNRLAITLEARMLPVFSSQVNGGAVIPAEWMIGARSSPVEDLALHLGIGSGLPPVDAAVTTLAFRLALAIVYSPMERHK